MSLRLSSFFVIFLVLSSFFLNYFFLQDFFGYGLTNEDIPYLRDYKADSNIADNNYFVKIYKTWTHTGLNWAHQILYVGTLDQLFPYNWELTHNLNFIWKVLAAVNLFPVLWVLTKRKLLATLATLIYSILPSSNGSLTINCTGTEYWGVIFLNLFIVSYYYLIKNQKSIKLLLLSFVLLYLAILSASTRMLPTFVLLVITEIILVVKNISQFKTTLLRLIIYLIPYYLLFRLVDPGTLSRGNIYNNLLKDLLAGNWQLLINPLAGLGFTLISADTVRLFGFYGSRNLSDFGGFVANLFGHGILPLIFVLTFIFAFIISHKPKHFIGITLILQFFFLIMIYVFATHYLDLPKELALPYNGTLDFATLPAILGAYIVAIALATGFEWYKSGRKDKMLLVIFISPLLSLSFISATWLSVGKHFGYEGPVHRYLTVPAVGMSVFISAIIFLIFKKIQTNKKISVIYNLFLAALFIYLISFSYKGNNQYFKMIKSLGENMAAQKHIQEVLFNTPAAKKDNLLLYYEPRIKTDEDKYWYTALNYGRMMLWLYLQKYYNSPDRKVNGCLDWVDNGFYSVSNFKKIYKYTNNQVTFNTISAFCNKDSITYPSNTHTFYQDDFFAFTLKGDQVVDITKEVLERLKQVDNYVNPI